MKPLVCEMCGSNDVVKKEDLFVCQNCGTKYSVEAAKKMMIEGPVEVRGSVTIDETQKIQTWITFAQTALSAGNMNEAYDYANKIIELTPSSVEAWMVRMKTIVGMSKLENPRTAEVLSIGKNIITLDSGKEDEVAHFYLDTGIKMLQSAFSLINGESGKEAALQNAKMLDSYCDQAVELEHAVAQLPGFGDNTALQEKGFDFVDAFQSFSESFTTFIYEFRLFDDETLVELNDKYEALDKSLRKDFPMTNYDNGEQSDVDSQANPSGKKSGCYVATAVYGSYDSPEVLTLRRFRDNTLATTWYGRAFIKTYYAVSPTLVKWFGNTSWFKNLWRRPLDRIVQSLQKNGIESKSNTDK